MVERSHFAGVTWERGVGNGGAGRKLGSDGEHPTELLEQTDSALANDHPEGRGVPAPVVFTHFAKRVSWRRQVSRLLVRLALYLLSS